MHSKKTLAIGTAISAALLSLAMPATAADHATTPQPSASSSASPTPSSSPSASPSPSTAIPPDVFARLVPATVPQGGRLRIVTNCFGQAVSTAFGVFWPAAPPDVNYATVYRDARIGQHEVVFYCLAYGYLPPLTLTVTRAQTVRTPRGGAGTGAGGTWHEPDR